MNEWKECPKCKCMNNGRDRCQDCGRDLKDVTPDNPLPPITAEAKPDCGAAQGSETVKYKSCALWPEACLVPDNYSEDNHDTLQQAEAVRDFLKRDGLGGNRQYFPIKAWVEKVESPNEKGQA